MRRRKNKVVGYLDNVKVWIHLKKGIAYPTDWKHQALVLANEGKRREGKARE